MERLTIPDVRIDKNTIRRSFIDAEKVKDCAMEIYWRLKSIEDAVADAESEEYDLDRLRELVKADRDGRCEVLPKPIGSDVYRIEYVKSSNGFEIGIKKHKFDYVFFAFERKNIGKTVFFDREAAEAALKGEQDG